MPMQVSTAPAPGTGTSSGPNDNLLAIAMAERAKSPVKPRATSGSAKAVKPVAAAAPKAPESGGSNDNLLAIAMAERANSPVKPRATSGSARAAKPAAAASARKPDTAPKVPGSGGPNDNLLAIAMAERAKGSSSPRRSARPTNLESSPKVPPAPPVDVCSVPHSQTYMQQTRLACNIYFINI